MCSFIVYFVRQEICCVANVISIFSVSSQKFCSVAAHILVLNPSGLQHARALETESSPSQCHLFNKPAFIPSWYSTWPLAACSRVNLN